MIIRAKRMIGPRGPTTDYAESISTIPAYRIDLPYRVVCSDSIMGAGICRGQKSLLHGRKEALGKGLSQFGGQGAKRNYASDTTLPASV